MGKSDDRTHGGITGKQSTVHRFDIVTDRQREELIKCIQSGGSVRVILDERVLENGQFGKYSQLID